jgi:hypothetical protein
MSGGRYQNWDQGGGDRGDGGVFLKLEKNNKYKVRLVGKPLHYYQHWEPIVCRSPYIDEQNNVICPLMLMGHKPKDRYSIWVLDRCDNKLKVMDFPQSLYNIFHEYNRETGKEPGGADGPDWSIRVEAPSGKQKFTKYFGTPLGLAAFTPEELSMIKEGKLKERLLDLRRDNTPDEIREMLAKKSGAAPQDDAASEDAHASAPPARAAAQAPAAQGRAQTSTPAPAAAAKADEFEF